MSQAALSAFVSQSARAVAHPTEPDGQLLARFVAARDEAAFAELVRRHGPFVLAVCRRTTGDRHLAEDAFQAAFVVLARRAADVLPRSGVRGFLYGIAVRVAREARAVSARRNARELPVPSVPDRPAEPLDPPDADTLRLLDEEVAALPDHLRAAVVLCELDGLARKEAATQLGVAEGTLSSRLAKARKLLAERLRKRGVTLPAVGLGVLAGSAPVSASLSAAAAAFASPGTAVPDAVVSLSAGVIRMMFAQKLRAALSLAAVAVGAVACAALAYSGPVPPAERVAPRAGPALVPRPADPPPRAAPKAPLKSPNKILALRTGHLILINPDGSNEKEVELGPADHSPVATCARLSPDGTTVATVVEATEGEGLAAKRVRGPLRLRTLDAGTETDLGVRCQSFVWSADGAEIACNEFKPQGETVISHFVVNASTKAKTDLKLPNNHLITDWSRDGKYFLTTAIDRTADETQMHLMNRDGTQHKVLTDEKGLVMFGRLSPDGTRILYTSVSPREARTRPGQNPRAELIVLTVATGKKAKVADVPVSAAVLGFCWSPDGKKIAYTWSEVPEGKPEEVADKMPPAHLVVCDPDGKDAKTILSKEFKLAFGVVDWR